MGGGTRGLGVHPGLSCASLFAIIEVGGVSEVVEVLGIGVGTVKTHLHHLFEKTGASRQAELVKLVAGYANVLLG
jgi:FixJ family two-component response regulator